MTYDRASYPYLEAEDRAFCQAFRLSEDTFLTMAGGLKAYTQHRLDRDAARGAKVNDLTFEVPPLPSDTKAAVAGIMLPGVTEADLAGVALKEQMNKVRGIMDAVRVDKEIKSWAADKGV